MRNGVQLITYADRLGGGGLETINRLLSGPFSGAFSGVHLLPFYTPYDGADAGFDPRDHATVDPRLGDWSSVSRIASSFDVMADLIVNHVSDESAQFLDFLENGDASAYQGMFLEHSTVFAHGDARADLVYRPRPGPPFTDKVFTDGSTRRLWTTFTPHQIDIDLSSPVARSYLMSVLDQFAAAGIASVRLDAVGYAVKKAGTSCFMIPETIELIRDLEREINQRSMRALLEIHSHFEDQIAASSAAERVYDFALPPLLLHALFTADASAVRQWLKVSPRNVVTVLDTHDGIGVIDVGPDATRTGLLNAAQIDEVVEGIHGASQGQSRQATGAAASNVDLYQVNCTYYSALGEDADRYLLTRLAQFLSPGIPQVYYAGLLAAPNAMELLELTGVGRDINRPYYSLDDIETQVQRPVVRRLLAMCRWRTRESVFRGAFEVLDSPAHELAVRWTSRDRRLEACLDFDAVSFSLTVDGAASATTWDDFASL